MLTRTFAAAILVGLTTASTAQARDFRVSQVPNGNVFSCNLCHNNGGGSPRNVFGQQVESNLVGANIATADVDWDAIYDLDADGDGFTNGDELGDPDGTGTADPSLDPTNPADASSNPDAGEITDTGDDTSTDATDATDGATDDGGGCSSAPVPGSAALVVLGALGLLSRRRR